MSKNFVWFHNSNKKPEDSVRFYRELLAWEPTESPPGMTMFAGDKGPFAAVASERGDLGWIPYAQVDDVDEATEKARSLGATVLEKKARGPAGEFTIVADPGGAAIALWQKA